MFAARMVQFRTCPVAPLALEEADARAMDAGANLALLGDELIQFGRATPLGDGRWRLGELLRGRYGTEAATPAAAGARFVLLEPETLAALDPGPAALGQTLRLLASGVGDGDGPAEARAVATGRSVLPPAPVHLAVATTADGAARVSWIRRSRLGWRWIDGADAPLGEEREAWEVRLILPDGAERVVWLDTPELVLGVTERAAGPVGVIVRQRGDWGLGAAARIVVPAL